MLNAGMTGWGFMAGSARIQIQIQMPAANSYSTVPSGHMTDPRPRIPPAGGVRGSPSLP